MKVIKQGSKVNEKLALPTDLHWKVFGSLISDLGLTALNTPDGLRYKDADDTMKEIHGVIRSRSPERLYDVLPKLDPLSIIQQTGSDKRDALAFFCLYQAGAFLKKFPFTGTDTQKPAFQKFREADCICKTFNNENYKGLLAISEKHPNYLGVVEELQADILDLLGEFPNIDSITSHAKHGPGVSLGNLYKGGRVTEYYKWQNLPYSVTRGALPLAKTAISSDPRWIGALDNWYRKEKAIPVGHPICMDDFWSSVLRVVEGSRTTSVPKTAVIDRTIAIEPLLNVYFQLGVDFLMRKSLKKWGYDLNTQELNQKFAYTGSCSGAYATVDLSMASDLISLKICEILLPPAWFDLLWDLRSPVTTVAGDTIPLEKISSMGNGFTFALESLVFASLVRCSIRRTGSKRESAVYGDDLIVPVTAYPYLKDLISYCGFRINVGKSYADGPFRESCGKDYFLGYDVRPLFLKRKIRSVRDLFYLHNAIFELQQRLDWSWDVDFTSTLEMVKRWIPKKFRYQFFGPPSESLDTHLFSSRRLKRNKFGQRVYWQIIARPKVFNRHTDFYFRKLMVTLKGRASPSHKWDLRRRLNTGNAFDVTRRGQVLLISAKVCMP